MKNQQQTPKPTPAAAKKMGMMSASAIAGTGGRASKGAASAMANAKKAGSEGAKEYMSGLPKNKKK